MNKLQWLQIADDLIADYSFCPIEKDSAEREALRLEMYIHLKEAHNFSGSKVKMLEKSLQIATKEILRYNNKDKIELKHVRFRN